MNKQLWLKIKEAFLSVFPVSCIVLILHLTKLAPLSSKQFPLFLTATILLIFGMGLFTLGADIAMNPMGEYTGSSITKIKKLPLIVVIIFLLGLLITVAEPDLTVLAKQLPIDSMLLIVLVGIGVGSFLVVAVLRIIFQKNLNILLIIFYSLVFLVGFILMILGKEDFLPVAFDSGGVTTGPITVPFIMALCIGIATVRGGKNSHNDSFGMVALCSIGPILMVMILSLFMKESPTFSTSDIDYTKSVVELYLEGFVEYAKEVLIALAPIVILFLIFNVLFIKIGKKKLIKMGVGIIYTYFGLVLFLTAVNIGYMPIGMMIGKVLASASHSIILIPIGFVIGLVVVLAEPAVHVLNKQVEQVSGGTISKKAMTISLSIGVGASIALSMLRIICGFSVIWYLVPGYLISLVLTFFVPKIYTAIAFDSGGVASGPMATGFILPLSIGVALTMRSESVLQYAFGIVAMVAMVPILTIEILGFISVTKHKAAPRIEVAIPDEEIIYF